jgi:hypothetical protein
MTELIVGELLSYVSFYRNKSNIDSLRRTVLAFYSPADIGRAKKLLSLKYAAKLESCPLLAERRNSSTRNAHEAELDDIIGVFETLDLKNELKDIVFVAANLDNLPKFGPEEFNLAAVVDRQVRTDAAVKDMSAAIEQLAAAQAGPTVATSIESSSLEYVMVKSMIADMQQKMDAFNSSINTRLEHLSTVCKTSLSTVQASESTSSHAQNNPVDRKLNIVVFGVAED